MTKGLRQGCPIAPLVYSAWSARFVRELNAIGMEINFGKSAAILAVSLKIQLQALIKQTRQRSGSSHLLVKCQGGDMYIPQS